MQHLKCSITDCDVRFWTRKTKPGQKPMCFKHRPKAKPAIHVPWKQRRISKPKPVQEQRKHKKHKHGSKEDQ